MKCRACDKILTDQEATHKDERGSYLDMCFGCLSDGIETLPEYPSYKDINEEFPEEEKDSYGEMEPS